MRQVNYHEKFKLTTPKYINNKSILKSEHIQKDYWGGGGSASIFTLKPFLILTFVL